MFPHFTSLGCLWVLCRGCVSPGLVNWGQGQGSSRDSHSHEMLCSYPPALGEAGRVWCCPKSLRHVQDSAQCWGHLLGLWVCPDVPRSSFSLAPFISCTQEWLRPGNWGTWPPVSIMLGLPAHCPWALTPGPSTGLQPPCTPGCPWHPEPSRAQPLGGFVGSRRQRHSFGDGTFLLRKA